MALFMKQDYSPPILSRKWISMKFRPNMLIYSREHIISILESGLMFREDSVEVEQEIPDPETVKARAGITGWLTRGERNIVVVTLAGLLFLSPPRNFHRSSLLKLSAYSVIPMLIRTAHRSYCRGKLFPLLNIMRDYTALARRAAACCREHSVVGVQLQSVSMTVSSMLSLLCRQQTELSLMMARASSALLGTAPWIRGDVPSIGEGTIVKIHHGFLVVQSTLLKYIALAHFVPTLQTFKLYKNQNERIFWIHNTLIDHVLSEFQENFHALERMYRLLKNYGSKDSEISVRRPSEAIKNWLYADIHTGVARSCMEMKMALDKATHLDMFLDSCALNKQTLDLDVLDRDIDEIVDNITKCLATVQSSQIRLKKMQNKLHGEEVRKDEEEYEQSEKNLLQIEDKEPEVRDEVFYFVKTDDERPQSPIGDIMTAPGQKEKENSKVVLKELRRKLVKREDLMRERERQALARTMPGIEVPEFPRQIKYEEFADRKGFIAKIVRRKRKSKQQRKRNYRLEIDKKDLNGILDEENVFKDDTPVILRRVKTKFLLSQKRFIPTVTNATNRLDLKEENKEQNAEDKYRVSKEELESPDSDFENIYNDKMALLNDVRRHRALRRKNFPAKRPSTDNADEGLQPIEYSFGTGMAMASVLQLNSNLRQNMLQEDVYIGDGEVSNDSGNDDD
ncbi:uncharacterized protein LOC116776747 isoform X2 [Danaus plexippus]|nr:uncharacterized protein LOC116776747 isoform X2 [Danaus plexippus]XP_061384906.1 uncharacterized protein LOC116776747 isoform X2 [Danaus plexippus]